MINLAKFDEYYLEKSWKWLNDMEIKTLTDTRDFTKESQRQWFNNLYNKSDYLIWGIETDGKPIGVCGLKKITEADCEYWGYIGEKQYWGKGIGRVIIGLMVGKAKDLKLRSLWLQVVATNDRAINLYLKSGFRIEKKETSLIYMRKKI